jgi:hypothetical protein
MAPGLRTSYSDPKFGIGESSCTSKLVPELATEPEMGKPAGTSKLDPELGILEVGTDPGIGELRGTSWWGLLLGDVGGRTAPAIVVFMA